ncbi:MAG TPA: hypothetical protein VF488_01060, partial [Gemmatimonadaceae bacterium]
PAGFQLVSVANSETDSASDIQGFTTGGASTEGTVRAARAGSGGGRAYTFSYVGSDKAGNTASCVAEVLVPHDRSDK